MWRVVIAMVSVIAVLTAVLCVGGLSAAAADTEVAFTGTSIELPLENFSKNVFNCKVIKASETVGNSQTKVDALGVDGDILRIQVNIQGIILQEQMLDNRLISTLFALFSVQKSIFFCPFKLIIFSTFGNT